MKSSHLRSDLKNARGLGSAKHGVSHWLWQRITAIALVPMCIWLLASLFYLLQTRDIFVITDWLASPLNALLLSAFIIAGFWHAKLGVQVVIEDYIHAPRAKYSLLFLNIAVCAGAALVALLSILKLHLIHMMSGL